MKTFYDYLALIEKSEVYTKESDTSDLATSNQVILKNLGIIVMGEMAGTSTIVAFSQHHVKRIEIKSIERMGMANVIQWFGEDMEQKIWSGKGTPDSNFEYTLSQLRYAIAAEGGKRQINDSDMCGGGAWEVNGRLLLVGDHELAIFNGKLERSEVPQVGETSIGFGSCEQWYDYEKLEGYLAQAQSQQWREGVVNELIELFALWDNWENDFDAQLVASLVMCTWLQTIWEWRPNLFVTGPTGLPLKN